MPEPKRLQPIAGPPIERIQCSACGCGYVVGLDPDAVRFAREVVEKGYGLRLVPDCPGCPCHTGMGLLPHLRVRYAPREA